MISEKLPSVRSISLGLWIGAGSRYEEPAESGISHFIEHLLFKGGSHYNARDIAEIFDSFGGELNAATAREYTVVHARFLDEHLKEAFEVMADMVIRPTFAEVDLEREVVVEEINMYDDSPGELIADYISAAIFDGHPLGQSVLGTHASIGAMTLKRLKTYHDSHYILPNMVVAAAGNIEHQTLVDFSRAYLSQGNGAGPLRPASSAPEAPAAKQARFYQKDTQQYHVSFGGVGLPRDDERRFQLIILDGILGSSASSRLFQEVREKRGLAYSVYSYASFYSDTGLVGVYFGCRKESVEEATRIVAGQLQSIIDRGVSGEELARAKESAKGRLVLGMETTPNRMSRLGKLTVTDSEILDIDEIIDRIAAVTLDEVQALAADLFRPENLTAVAIGPEAGVFEKALDSLGGSRELTVKSS